MSFRRLLWATFLGLVLSEGALAATSEVLQVRLLPRVAVMGPDFTVGDVAKVLGQDATRCERVQKVVVGRAPLPDHTYRLGAQTLRVALRKAGYSEVDVQVADGESVVSTETQKYPLSNILPALRADILKSTGEAPANVEVVPSASFEKTLVLPQGKVTTRLRPPVSGRYDGSVLYVVDLMVDGRKLKTMPMRVTVRIERPVVVVTHRVDRGETFDEGKSEIQKLSSGVGSDSVTLLSQALGKTSARAIFPGTPLRFQDIADPPLIKRGQEVNCRGRKGNVEIEVTVKAMEDGKLGRVIRVQNTGSQKLLKARVVDETTVEAVAGPENGRH